MCQEKGNNSSINFTVCLSSIVFIGFVVRIIANFHVGWNHSTFGDALDYIKAAKTICEHGDYPERSHLPFFRAPGFPILLAISSGCHIDNNLPLIKLAIVLIDCMSIFVIYLLGVSLLKDRCCSFIGSTLYALYPPFIFQTTDLRTESLTIALLMLGFYLLILGLSRGKNIAHCLSGITMGFVSLTRPVALVLIPFIVLILIICVLKNKQKSLSSIAFFLFGLMLCLGPWSYFNFDKYGEVILVNDAGGYNFWRGAHPKMRAIYKVKDLEEFNKLQREFEEEISPAVAVQVNNLGRSPMFRNKIWYEKGIDIICEDLVSYVKFSIFKALVFWRPWLNSNVYPLKVVVLSSFLFIGLYFFSIYGAVLLFRKEKIIFIVMLFYIIMIWMAHIPFQVVVRFRMAFIEPLLLILASIALSREYKKLTFFDTYKHGG